MRGWTIVCNIFFIKKQGISFGPRENLFFSLLLISSWHSSSGYGYKWRRFIFSSELWNEFSKLFYVIISFFSISVSATYLKNSLKLLATLLGSFINLVRKILIVFVTIIRKFWYNLPGRLTRVSCHHNFKGCAHAWFRDYSQDRK